ncbi:MAG: hypothetical protein J6P05_01705 [Lachnospiraceae bacterium]|nr:hypothetical protein [Lachnospiraceae bacterium]
MDKRSLLLEKTIQILKKLPAPYLEAIYDSAVYLNSNVFHDSKPVHDIDGLCPLCRTYSFLNDKTLEAIKEINRLSSTDSGERFESIPDFIKDLEG